MQEILDIFLEKSKQHHSNIIYAQIYKNDLLKEEFRLFPVKTRLNIWSISKPFVAMAAGIAEREGLILYFICSSGREIRNGSAELSAISFL